MMHLFASTSPEEVMRLGKAAATREGRAVYATVRSSGE
jgi:hypothetical protein